MRLTEQFKKRLQKLAGLKNLQEQDRRRRKPSPKPPVAKKASFPLPQPKSDEGCAEQLEYVLTTYAGGYWEYSTDTGEEDFESSTDIFCSMCLMTDVGYEDYQNISPNPDNWQNIWGPVFESLGILDVCNCCIEGEGDESDHEEPDTSSQPSSSDCCPSDWYQFEYQDQICKYCGDGQLDDTYDMFVYCPCCEGAPECPEEPSSNYACTPCEGCQPSDDGPFSSLEECEGTCSETNIDTFFDGCPSAPQCAGFNSKEEFCDRCEVAYEMTQQWASQNNLPNCDCCNPEPEPDPTCSGYVGDIYGNVPYEYSLEFCTNTWAYQTNLGTGCVQVGSGWCNATDNCPGTYTYASQESCCENTPIVFGYEPSDWEETCG
jgi:hypothetical protein